jgi:hypothetical protein
MAGQIGWITLLHEKEIEPVTAVQVSLALALMG